MQRFYLKDTILPETFCTLSSLERDSLYHQITRVLRSKPGDEIVFFSGNGKDYVYIIQDITRNDVHFHFARIEARDYKTNSVDQLGGESPKQTDSTSGGIQEISIVLFQALPNKQEKLEFILQKGVEVGISEFVFFASERSQGLSGFGTGGKNKYPKESHISSGRVFSRLEPNQKIRDRLEHIVTEATEQSFSARPPKITFIDSFEDIHIPLYVAHTSSIDTATCLRDISFQKTDSLGIVIGPEGGFSDSEIETFKKMNASFLYFGGRILRTETAGIALTFFIRQKHGG